MCVPGRVGAQTSAAKFVDSARVEIDRAVRDDDGARLDRTLVLLDRALVTFPDDPWLLHYRGYGAYRRVVRAFATGKKNTTVPWIGAALLDLAKSAEKVAWPETVQLEASLKAFQVALDSARGPKLRSSIAELSAEATRLGPNNPRVLLLQAIAAQNTTDSLGGGVARARELVTRALAAFASDRPSRLAPAWGHAEAMALLRRLGGGRVRGQIQ